MNKLKLISPTVLRIGMSLVFLWFGLNQMTNPSAWVGYVPDWAVSLSTLSAATIVHYNAIFEIVFGMLLFLGFFTRFAAFLLLLHIADITYTVGFDAIGMRDFGLTVAMFSVWLNGYDFLTLDRFIKHEEYMKRKAKATKDASDPSVILYESPKF